MLGEGRRSLVGCFIENNWYALSSKKCLLEHHSQLHTSLGCTWIPDLKVAESSLDLPCYFTS